MSAVSFEQLDDDDVDGTARPDSALWSMRLDDPNMESEILKWLHGERKYLEDKNHSRFMRMKRNQQLYKGIQYASQEVREDLRDRTLDRSKNIPKIVVNHLYDLTQNRINRLVKYKPALQILPTNDEFQDVIASRATKKLLDHIWYIQDYQGYISPRVATNGEIHGESYLFITWDPSKGDIHPKSPKEGERVPLLDESGSITKDSKGNTIYIDRPVMTGDVKYEVEPGYNVLFQRAQCLADSEYCYRKKVGPVEKLRLLYPKKADKIKKVDNLQEFDFETNTMSKLPGETRWWEFYFKATPEMPKGRYIVFTEDAILHNDELPYSHGELPLELFTDIDLPDELHAMSFFETVKHLTSTYNNITNLIVRNNYLVSHPKWMVPAGSVKLDSLGNDITIVQFRGPQAPVLVQANPTGREVFEFRKELKEEFQQISGVFGVSRGEPPSGIKAGVALQFLNEQEAERFNLLTLKWNEFHRRVAIKTLSVCGDYYETDDNRMVRVLGKNDKWQTMFFDAAHLSKDYDIRVQNSSALPQSKAARVQTLIDLRKEFPTIVSDEQMIELMDLGQNDKFVNIAAVAVRTAEAENENILNGDDVVEPQEYEDHIQHWKIHVRAMQEGSFKQTVPKNLQEKLKDHVLLTEKYMVDAAKKNPAFAEKVAALDLFPLFYTPEGKGDAEPPLPAEDLPAASMGDGGGPFGLVPELPVNPEIAGQPTEPEPGSIQPAGASPEQEPPPVPQGGSI